MNYLKFTDEEFDACFVIKVYTDAGEKYFFSKRILVSDIGLAKKFNTVRSAKRSIKLYSVNNYEIIKLKNVFLN